MEHTSNLPKTTKKAALRRLAQPVRVAFRFSPEKVDDFFLLPDNLHVVDAKMDKDGSLIVFVNNTPDKEPGDLSKYFCDEPVYTKDPGTGEETFGGFARVNPPKWNPKDERK